MKSNMYSEEYLSDGNLVISQWANEVVDFSDSYGSGASISYSARNICGEPSNFPAYGDFAECFSMRKYGPASDTEREISLKDQQDVLTFHDFIIVKYEHYVLPREINILETFNPGAIIRILAYCCTIKKWKILWQSSPEPSEKRSRDFCPPLKEINFPTRILRIEFNHSLIDYYTGIDSVLLTGLKCKLPIETPLSDNAIMKGVIQKRLEVVLFNPFKPQKTPSEAIEDFLKNDLNRFIENPGSSSHAAESGDRNAPPTIVELRSNEKEKVITDIPYEILFNAFSYLDLKSLYQCSQVCRSFRQLVFDPLLYVEINLKLYWHIANSCLMETLTNRCSLIKKLDLSSCGYFESIKPSDFISFIQANGKSLTHLRLDSSQFLNTSCLETISITCSNLTELTLRNYMNVTSDRDFVSLNMLNKLEVLDLSRSGIDNVTLLNILKNNQNLMRLNVAFSSPHSNMDDVCIQISTYNLKMKSIDFWKCHNLTSRGVLALSKLFWLEELDFGWCLREEASLTDSFNFLIQNCKYLKKLIITAVRSMTERDIENVASYCKNLEKLDLMGIIGVTSDTCLRILESCSKLRLLDISFCENVDDANIMIWRNRFNVCIKRCEVPYADESSDDDFVFSDESSDE